MTLYGILIVLCAPIAIVLAIYAILWMAGEENDRDL